MQAIVEKISTEGMPISFTGMRKVLAAVDRSMAIDRQSSSYEIQ
ncbi:MAG: hypothetical protein ACJ8AW_43285 [Rhodopila sp.]